MTAFIYRVNSWAAGTAELKENTFSNQALQGFHYSFGILVFFFCGQGTETSLSFLASSRTPPERNPLENQDRGPLYLEKC